MLENWVFYTGTIEINVKSEFSKKTNEISLEINQRNSLTRYLARQKMLNSKFENKSLSASNLYSKNFEDLFGKDETSDLPPLDEDQYNEAYDNEECRHAARWFKDE